MCDKEHLTTLCFRYNHKIFRTTLDKTKTCCSNHHYRQQREILNETGTRRCSVSHDDRHYGAFWAVMHNVNREDIRSLGHWNVDTMDLHYTKIVSPETVAKMLGFADQRHYYLQRAQLNPFNVEDDEIRKMAGKLFAKLEDERFLKVISEVSPCFADYKQIF